MVKVITYGTYDLLHYGHIRLLERAKALGDYLIVGITADDFDKTRGKINVQQSLIERVEAVRKTGIADEIIVEEYEGQKIDDIKKYNIDIFTVGSDWIGKFDYLEEYCRVVYLPRTEGISSSEIREKKRAVSLGIVGESLFVNKVINECEYVNGLDITCLYADKNELSLELNGKSLRRFSSFKELLQSVDAVYIHSEPHAHYRQVREALEMGVHVLCELPIAMQPDEANELYEIAEQKGLVLMEGIKTAYATAFSRLLLLAKGKRIGSIVGVDAVCTSLREPESLGDTQKNWNSICDWGPTALLPIFALLGTDYRAKTIITQLDPDGNKYDRFTRINFVYKHAFASVLIGKGVKSEGSMTITGTKGYIYVPAPWWKTEYFELRYENPADNRRYFFQLDGEGIRYELVAFARAIEKSKSLSAINKKTSVSISAVIADFYSGTDTIELERER